MLEETKLGINRPAFENIITLLEKVKWIESKETSFEKDGRSITYKNIFLLKPFDFTMAQELTSLQISSNLRADPSRKNSRKVKRKKETTFNFTSSQNNTDTKILEPLKAWRLAQARKKNIPAFRILTDKALQAICEQRPRSISALLEISSVNRKAIVQYGNDIIRVVRDLE